MSFRSAAQESAAPGSIHRSPLHRHRHSGAARISAVVFRTGTPLQGNRTIQALSLQPESSKLEVPFRSAAEESAAPGSIHRPPPPSFWRSQNLRSCFQDRHSPSRKPHNPSSQLTAGELKARGAIPQRSAGIRSPGLNPPQPPHRRRHSGAARISAVVFRTGTPLQGNRTIQALSLQLESSKLEMSFRSAAQESAAPGSIHRTHPSPPSFWRSQNLRSCFQDRHFPSRKPHNPSCQLTAGELKSRGVIPQRSAGIRSPGSIHRTPPITAVILAQPESPQLFQDRHSPSRERHNPSCQLTAGELKARGAIPQRIEGIRSPGLNPPHPTHHRRHSGAARISAVVFRTSTFLQGNGTIQAVSLQLESSKLEMSFRSAAQESAAQAQPPHPTHHRRHSGAARISAVVFRTGTPLQGNGTIQAVSLQLESSKLEVPFRSAAQESAAQAQSTAPHPSPPSFWRSQNLRSCFQDQHSPSREPHNPSCQLTAAELKARGAIPQRSEGIRSCLFYPSRSLSSASLNL